jgi:hypothetical protein
MRPTTLGKMVSMCTYDFIELHYVGVGEPLHDRDLVQHLYAGDLGPTPIHAPPPPRLGQQLECAQTLIHRVERQLDLTEAALAQRLHQCILVDKRNTLFDKRNTLEWRSGAIVSGL